MSKLLPLQRSGGGTAVLSDEALLAACAVGDHGALSVLFQRHHGRVHGFCERLAPGADVEDLVQNTFLAAWTRAASFRGHASARAWLFAIAANLARKSRRSEERKRSALSLLRLVPAPPSRPVDEQVCQRQLLGRLAEALEELPHDLRVAFVLCEIEEVPGVEAARVLEIRPGTLWRRLHDARKRLLPLLEGEKP
ncbi:RNA polymerase sigma factor [Vulgatibacter sp.]|uniref:RNA polymerase sigma factor n=1 Tax=Vulgatibacter sp. TaxID=1971226 RepID=UPI003563773A